MRALTAAVMIVSVAAGCACGGASSRGAAEPDDDDRVVRHVDIAGNQAIGDDTLTDGMAIHPPEGWIRKSYADFDEIALDEDIDRIETYYKRNGYFAARVADVDVRDVGSDGVAITIEVEEGAPTRIRETRVNGLPERLVGDERLAEITSELGRDRVYDHEAYLAAKTRLLSWVQASGYVRAEIDGVVNVDRDRGEAKIDLQVKSGPLVRYGATRIKGLEDVPTEAVENRLYWKPGQIVDPADFRESRAQLYQLGFFRGVEIRLDDPEDGDAVEIADVVVELSEMENREVRLGGGLAADNAHYEVRARAGYTMHHLLHPLSTFRVDLKPAYTILRGDTGSRGFGGEGTASFDKKDLFYRRVVGEVRGSYQQVELEAYSSRGPGGRLSVNRPFFTGALSVSIGWEIRYLTFLRIHPAIAEAVAEDIGLVDPYRVAFLDQSVAYDRRDNILDAHEGYYLELRLEESGPWSGSQYDYFKITGDARGYLPLTRRLVAAARLSAGDTLSGDLPITQRYFWGGASSHRGFGNRQLAPVVTSDDPEIGSIQVGGETLASTSAELRYDVTELWERWLGVVAFVDAGDVTNEIGALDLANPHWATGLGLRYNTPVGPIRVDLGYRLNRTGPGEPEAGSRFAFHLSLGEAF
jgi:translocation and assembly module TamA